MTLSAPPGSATSSPWPTHEHEKSESMRRAEGEIARKSLILGPWSSLLEPCCRVCLHLSDPNPLTWLPSLRLQLPHPCGLVWLILVTAPDLFFCPCSGSVGLHPSPVRCVPMPWPIGTLAQLEVHLHGGAVRPWCSWPQKKYNKLVQKRMCTEAYAYIYVKNTQNAYFVLSCFTGITGVYPRFGLAFFCLEFLFWWGFLFTLVNIKCTASLFPSCYGLALSVL